MNIQILFNDKTIKPKDKTTQLSEMVLNNTLSIEDIILYAKAAKDPVKATCIEALEFASKIKPEIMTDSGIDFIIESLGEKAPRIKWESAKVTGNVIHLFLGKIDSAVKMLLNNTEDKGTVVRWSAAFALGQIVKLKTPINEILVPTINNIIENEEKNSIKKIYMEALKKMKK